MANIYLLRHGKVSGEPALNGVTDVPVNDVINDEIVKQFSDYCWQAGTEIAHIYSSPLIRCKVLAERIAQSPDSSSTELKIELKDDLKEMDFGRYDGIPFDELYQQQAPWQQLEKFWQNPVQHPLPEAELLTGFSYRIERCWAQIVAFAQRENKNVVVVCHGGVIRMILAHVLNVDYRNPQWYTQLTIATGSVTSLKTTEQGCCVEHIGKPLLGEQIVQEQTNRLSREGASRE